MLKKTRTILRLLPWGLGKGQLMRRLIELGLGALIIAALLPSISAHNGEPGSQSNAAAQSCSSGAGMSSAVAQVQPDEEACRVESPQSQVNNDVVDATAIDVGGHIYSITSTAVGNTGSCTPIVSYSSLTSGLVMFGKAILAIDGDVTLTGNSRVTSSPDSGVDTIHANGNVCLSGNTVVEANASATGRIVKNGNAMVMGSTTESANMFNFWIDTSPYLPEADEGGNSNGDYIIDGTDCCLLGPIHITGDLVISGKATVVLGGTVYVDGMIRISGSTCIQGSEIIVAEGGITVATNSRLPNPGNIPVIVSLYGDISVTGNGWTSAVLYASDGEVSLSGNAKVYGCVVGMSVRGSGNSEVRYSLV